MFKYLNNYSPVSQDFIWVAEYIDGSHFAEFDFVTKKNNSFFSIDKSKLLRFGLIGHGMHFYFDVDGVFHLVQPYEFILKTEERKILLTRQKDLCSDIITFKDAESVIDLSGKSSTPSGNIMQYNFGYKTTFNIDNLQIHFKPICKIPFNKPVHLSFWVSVNKEINGTFQILNNGIVIFENEISLTSNQGAEMNWVVGL